MSARLKRGARKVVIGNLPFGMSDGQSVSDPENLKGRVVVNSTARAGQGEQVTGDQFSETSKPANSPRASRCGRLRVAEWGHGHV
jgi:hypothetical protein